MLFLWAVFPGRRKTESIRRFFSRGCLTGKDGLWRPGEGGVPDDPNGRHTGNVPIPPSGNEKGEWHYRGTENKAADVPGCRVCRMVPMSSHVGDGLYRGSDVEDGMKRL